ncbi:MULTISPECIES: HsdR family type I site-specific deoxyribonuclease [Niastella]|uniref:Type I restriction enzyme endonuclease subunit n=1 Tax=Niastella soli TaxID=2821487 RepID=A0ABS3Z3X8_9BACT|nr:HsdR family type I site-specific deoxyribonuclease [Niastella soli]MBO9204849.1 type I restriction endonuclease subunit R [Niastella soli]
MTDLKELDIRQHTFNQLKKMGYVSLSSADVNQARRGNNSSPFLESILESQLLKLNAFLASDILQTFSKYSIEEAYLALKYVRPNNYSKIYNWLLHGNSQLEFVESGSKRVIIQYIDWNNIDNNTFHFVSEFEAAFGEEIIRIDLALFVNGIPIILINFKSPSSDGSIFNKLESLNNQQQKSTPLSFAQLLLLINSDHLRYNTTNANTNYWHQWRAPGKNNATELKDALYDLCAPRKLLTYINHFILTSDAQRVPATWYQVEAVVSVLKRIQLYNQGDPKRGGYIAHPTGSGKTRTMMFLAQYLLQARSIVRSQILIITDRVELENQFLHNFLSFGLPISSANSLQSLLNLLISEAPIIITNSQKFYNTDNLSSALTDRQDLFILVDEVHRGYSGVLGQTIKRLFPDACFIGFTSFPIQNKLPPHIISGELIHLLSLQNAVDNNIILPTIYENRSHHFSLNKVDEYNPDEIKKTWKKRDRSLFLQSQEKTIHTIADDIIKHFYACNKGTPFKAILVAPSRQVAIEYKRYFDSLKGTDQQINSQLLISDTTNAWDEEDSYHNIQQFNKQEVLQQIQSTTNELELVIVCNMLLSESSGTLINTLYLTQYLQGTYLLQAIGRISRLYPGKMYGRVVDYVGVMNQLTKALEAYNQPKEMIIPVEKELQQLELHFTDIENIKNVLLGNTEKIKRRIRYNKMPKVELEELYLSKLLKCEEIIKLNSYNLDSSPSLEIKGYKERLSLLWNALKEMQTASTESSRSLTQTVDNLLSEKKETLVYKENDLLTSIILELLKQAFKKKTRIKDQQLTQYSESISTSLKSLAIRDWQSNAKSRRDMQNEVEDILIMLNKQHDVKLSFNEIDDLIESFIKSASLLLVNSKD